MILQRLRTATRPDHERLEAHIDLLGRAWSLPFYCALLQRFYGFYDVIEPRVFARGEWKSAGFDIEKRYKTHLLRCDLRALGLSDEEIYALPRCDNVPFVSNFAEALGCAYVLEGATLGGQVITRHLHRELGVEPNSGALFFSSYGPAVGSMWQEFVAFLDSYQGGPGEEIALVQNACDTFVVFDYWLADIL